MQEPTCQLESLCVHAGIKQCIVGNDRLAADGSFQRFRKLCECRGTGIRAFMVRPCIAAASRLIRFLLVGLMLSLNKTFPSK